MCFIDFAFSYSNATLFNSPLFSNCDDAVADDCCCWWWWWWKIANCKSLVGWASKDKTGKAHVNLHHVHNLIKSLIALEGYIRFACQQQDKRINNSKCFLKEILIRLRKISLCFIKKKRVYDFLKRKRFWDLLSHSARTRTHYTQSLSSEHAHI